MIFTIWLDTRPKMETHDPNFYPTILGGVSRGFLVSVLGLGRSKCHFLALENGQFWQKFWFSAILSVWTKFIKPYWSFLLTQLRAGLGLYLESSSNIAPVSPTLILWLIKSCVKHLTVEKANILALLSQELCRLNMYNHLALHHCGSLRHLD